MEAVERAVWALPRRGGCRRRGVGAEAGGEGERRERGEKEAIVGEKGGCEGKSCEEGSAGGDVRCQVRLRDIDTQKGERRVERVSGAVEG